MIAVAVVILTAANYVEERLSSVEAELIDVAGREYIDAPSDIDTEELIKRMDTPVHYNSSNASEKVATLPVPETANETHRRVIYSLAVPDLAPGDILQVMAEFQVTNDLGYNVMCVAQVILADSETDVAGAEITEANGRNVTPDMHHDTFPKVGGLTVTTEGTKYVNVVAWCASSRAETGATVRVDADYGRLSVIRY